MLDDAIEITKQKGRLDRIRQEREKKKSETLPLTCHATEMRAHNRRRPLDYLRDRHCVYDQVMLALFDGLNHIPPHLSILFRLLLFCIGSFWLRYGVTSLFPLSLCALRCFAFSPTNPCGDLLFFRPSSSCCCFRVVLLICVFGFLLSFSLLLATNHFLPTDDGATPGGGPLGHGKHIDRDDEGREGSDRTLGAFTPTGGCQTTNRASGRGNCGGLTACIYKDGIEQPTWNLGKGNRYGKRVIEP